MADIFPRVIMTIYKSGCYLKEKHGDIFHSLFLPSHLVFFGWGRVSVGKAFTPTNMIFPGTSPTRTFSPFLSSPTIWRCLYQGGILTRGGNVPITDCFCLSTGLFETLLPRKDSGRRKRTALFSLSRWLIILRENALSRRFHTCGYYAIQTGPG